MVIEDIEKVMYLSKQMAWDPGQMGLSESSLKTLCLKLCPEKHYHILELGGGQSTIFWKIIKLLDHLSITVTTLQHDQVLTQKLKDSLLEFKDISIYQSKLKQITDDEWENIFRNPKDALQLWKGSGTLVPKEQHNHYTIHNTFYTNLDQFKPGSIDVMIVDGPHGNGRSLAYPLFSQIVKPDAFILIDDFDHYPFLIYLHQIFNFTEIARNNEGDQRWVLVQLNGLRTT